MNVNFEAVLVVVCAVRDKSQFLEAPFRKSDITIGVDNPTNHSVFRRVLENELKLELLCEVVHVVL